MQALDLNLASRPFRNNSIIWWSFALAFLAIAALTYGNVDRYLDYRAKYDSQSQNMTSFEDRMISLKDRLQKARSREGRYDLSTLTMEANKANEVIEWKAFSWTRLFNRLEAVHPWNVRMQEIKPVFRGQQRGNEVEIDFTSENAQIPVVVEGLAKDLRALLEFQRRLFEDPNFADPEPERYETTDTNELQFTMLFYYYPNRSLEEPEPEGEGEGGESGDGGEAKEGENVADAAVATPDDAPSQTPGEGA